MTSGGNDGDDPAKLDEAMALLDSFLAQHEGKFPPLMIMSVMLQRGVEMSMEAGIPRKGLLAQIDKLRFRTQAAASARAARGKGPAS